MQSQRVRHGFLLILAVGALISALPVAAPVYAESRETAIRKAVGWLREQQLPDGGFGFRRPDGTAAADAKTTADVIYALTLAGEDVAGPEWMVDGKTPLDALAVLAPSYVGTDAGQAGKVARAVVLSGRNPRDFAGMDLLATIEAAYDPLTGRYHPSFLFRHTLAMEALVRAGEPVPPAAVSVLKSAQLPDGGWFWAFGAARSDIDTSGRVVQVLAAFDAERCAPNMTRAVRYLAGSQLDTGGWGVYPPPDENPANGNSTGLAISGLSAAGVDANAAEFAVAGQSPWVHLLAFQEPSGAFVYMRETGKEEVRVMATVDALIALSQPVLEEQSCPIFLPIPLAR
jgi:hypothetical protein